MGIFNLSVIPDWEMIGSAQRRLSSLDCLSEEVNPQVLNRVPWNGGDSPSQQTNEEAQLLVWLQGYTTNIHPLIYQNRDCDSHKV